MGGIISGGGFLLGLEGGAGFLRELLQPCRVWSLLNFLGSGRGELLKSRCLFGASSLVLLKILLWESGPSLIFSKVLLNPSLGPVCINLPSNVADNESGARLLLLQIPPLNAFCCNLHPVVGILTPVFL